jgi:hypothetical protein
VLNRIAKTAGAVVLGLALIAPTAARADAVQDLVDKYIQATGGVKAHKAVKSRTQKGTMMLVDMGMSASIESYIAPPNFLNVVNVEGFGEVRSGISGDTTWQMNPMQGDSILEGGAAKGLQRQASLSPWLEWKKWYTGGEVLGDADWEGEAATKVSFSKEEGEPDVVYFSKESGLIIGQETVGQDGSPASQTLSDYQDVDGVKLPHKITTSGMMNIEIEFTETKQNVEIPAETFELPETIAALK